MAKNRKNDISDLYDSLFGEKGKLPSWGKIELTGGNTKKPVSPELEAVVKAQSANMDEIERMMQSIRDEVSRDFTGRPITSSPQADADPQKKVQEKSQEAAQAEAETKPAEPEADPMEQLNDLVGLSDIKHDVKELINLMKVQKMRQDAGMKVVPVSKHLVFSGNPGTGKTTVARILSKLYKNIGVLSKGQLVEVDRSSLVAGFVGQTAIKTQEKLTEALGGVLFVDEAYTLVKEGGNDFGQEAIDTILKAMEDHRDDLVVIVAGYTDLMEHFINSNPGLKSRFNKFFYFADYSVKELMKIFEGFCTKYDYTLGDAAREAVTVEITRMEAEKGDNFANARSVRNLFESIITNQASRVAGIEAPTPEDIRLILPEDLVEQTEDEESLLEAQQETAAAENEP